MAYGQIGMYIQELRCNIKKKRFALAPTIGAKLLN